MEKVAHLLYFGLARAHLFLSINFVALIFLLAHSRETNEFCSFAVTYFLGPAEPTYTKVVGVAHIKLSKLIFVVVSA